MKRYIILFLLILSTIPIKSQNDDFKFWSPDVQLTCNDYLGKATRKFRKGIEKYGTPANGIFSIIVKIDIPANSQERGRLKEKVYVVPVFNKNRSIILCNDTIDFERQKIYFDIAELFSRILRSNFDQLLNVTDYEYGTVISMYSRVAAPIFEKYKQMIGDYTYAVFTQKSKQDNYQGWKDLIDLNLAKFERYATTESDNRRIILDKPIVDGYVNLNIK